MSKTIQDEFQTTGVNLFFREYIGEGKYRMKLTAPQGIDIGDKFKSRMTQETELEIIEIVENRDAKGEWKEPLDAFNAYYEVIAIDHSCKSYPAGVSYRPLLHVGKDAPLVVKTPKPETKDKKASIPTSKTKQTMPEYRDN